MTDNLKPEARRRTMQAVKGKGTRLEKRLFSMLAGMRVKGWTKNAAGVLGKPDIAFTKEKLAIFVDGCFWHGCAACQRPLPRTNRQYWKAKIERNKRRALQANRQLRAQGWSVLHVWEHQLRTEADLSKVRAKLSRAIAYQGAKAATFGYEPKTRI